ncbi:DUF3097 domain-containing protein [Actinopolymorpha pittospori]|uniref:DUF3097 domain-containing protein n=1 Tax=Actinopolymorpha pittospori TaxID=648752 RepID=A0A927MY85_9ACTN|nr:DUF3097 domain-containing protein [Actinopolymorpha pittospori]MBE1608784.1 hypothetical protein [Actinopolymorpha pittospori]
MAGSHDRYEQDVLKTDWRAPKRGRSVDVDAEPDMVLEDATTGFCGAIVAIERDLVILEDRRGARRSYPYGPGFLLEGKPVAVRRPKVSVATGPARTASGSIAVRNSRARVARASRIYVEGRHDAELIEKVWGDDLRIEGVAVEYLSGVDDLAAVVAEFRPDANRRLGVLVDHLVTGSKESRIAAEVARGPYGGLVLVVGHPYIDIWQAVRPERVGLEEWPDIPRETSWKHGICAALGWPHADQADIAQAWRRILGVVRDYRDLEPTLLGRVEQLIDFVTAEGDSPGAS